MQWLLAGTTGARVRPWTSPGLLPGRAYGPPSEDGHGLRRRVYCRQSSPRGHHSAQIRGQAWGHNRCPSGQGAFDSGAYGGFKPTPAVNLGGASKAGGPYKIPHVHIEGVQVYTNTIPGGFMRAPGEPQALFAIESHIDASPVNWGSTP